MGTCEVCCLNVAVVTRNTGLSQPITHAYCKRCHENGFEPYDTCLAVAVCVGWENTPQWARDVIERSVLFHDKSLDEFLREVRAENERIAVEAIRRDIEKHR